MERCRTCSQIFSQVDGQFKWHYWHSYGAASPFQQTSDGTFENILRNRFYYFYHIYRFADIACPFSDNEAFLIEIDAKFCEISTVGFCYEFLKFNIFFIHISPLFLITIILLVYQFIVLSPSRYLHTIQALRHPTRVSFNSFLFINLGYVFFSGVLATLPASCNIARFISKEISTQTVAETRIMNASSRESNFERGNFFLSLFFSLMHELLRFLADMCSKCARAKPTTRETSLARKIQRRFSCKEKFQKINPQDAVAALLARDKFFFRVASSSPSRLAFLISFLNVETRVFFILFDCVSSNGNKKKKRKRKNTFTLLNACSRWSESAADYIPRTCWKRIPQTTNRFCICKSV